MKTLTLEELSARLASATPPQLVEALPERYYLAGHLPGAVNINVNEVTAKAPGLLPAMDAPIVVYCASVTCANSDQVAVQLHALGYRDVAVYKGGKAEWEAAGHALAALAA